MASATGIPERYGPGDERTGSRQNETEPLLGRPGDAAQPDGVPFAQNLILGKSAPLALTMSTSC
jgi:cytochrome b-561